MSKVVLVTGGNKGIGYAICQRLFRLGHQVILTARNEAAGKEAVDKILAEEKPSGGSLSFVPLDLDNVESVEHAREEIQKRYPEGLDALINNAGIAFKNSATEPFSHQAKVTLATNYFATAHVCDRFLPLVKEEGGRIVNVSSTAGLLKYLSKEELREKLSSPSLSRSELDQLMTSFVNLTQTNSHQQLGWPNSAYGTSKIGLTALTKVMAREEEERAKREGKGKVGEGKRGRLINACCPGYVSTDMSSHKGHKTPWEGAETPVWLAVDPSVNFSGGFFQELKPHEW